MDAERLASLQKAPADASTKYGQCGNVLALKEGQLFPPRPKCGQRQFECTEAAPQC